MMRNSAPLCLRRARIGWIVVLGLAAVGLTQCRGVSDRIAGVRLDAPHTLSQRSRCTRDCQSEFESARFAEGVRYRAAIRECRGDAACEGDQRRLHRLSIEGREDERRKCKHGCYNEGAGRSGE